jgi:hypothetical protein
VSARDAHAVRLWLVGVALPCLAMLAIASVAIACDGGTVTTTEHRAAEICFPAASWGGPGSTASAEDRPCDVIGRPQEDGSGSLRLGTVGADAAVCTIPNPYEERGRFAVRCHRVPDRPVAR